MWLRRTVTVSVVFFIQLLILGDILNRRQLDPTLDVDWTKVFAVTIAYAAIAFLFIVATFFSAGVEYVRARTMSTGRVTAQGGVQYSVADNNLLESARSRRNAKIYLYDGIIDLTLFTTLAVLLGLVIDQLESIDGGGEPTRAWGVVLVPWFVFLALLLLFSVWLALRVYAEKRFERSLNNSDCCGAACGDMFVCCTMDIDSLDTARAARADKRPTYQANAVYHRLPCAFMCTPSLAYGALDTLLSWTWFTLLLALLISSILLACRLDSADGASPALLATFVPLFVVFSLLALVSLLLIFTLLCCYRTVLSRPAGGSSVLAKYAEAFLTVFVSALALAQLGTLGAQADNADADADWHLVFLPAYLLFTLGIFVGCCCFACRVRPRGYGALEDLDDNDPPPTSSADKARLRADPTSMYGVLSAVAE
jgi:MFS family permease